MLGFLKKLKIFKRFKKKQDPSLEEDATDFKKEPEEKKTEEKKTEEKKTEEKKTEEKKTEEKEIEKEPKLKKKKKFSIKLILTIFLVIAAFGAAGFVVYFFFLAPKDSQTPAKKYEKIELNHLQLPEELLKFSFKYLPDVYSAMITYNNEITLLDAQIARIDTIGQQYPDQKKITDKEKKVWEKTKAKLEKTFIKIQNPVKEIYVLFRVNEEQGLAQIETRRTELAELANTALAPVQEMTQKLKIKEKVPEGLINGTLYKIKKKFL